MDFSGRLANSIFDTLTFISQRSISMAIIRQLEKRREVLDPDEVKYAALTFDDGPGAYTSRLLDIFRDNDSQATFFLAGNKLEANKDIVIRYKKEGHGVGNHLYSHTPLPKMSSAAINDEIAETDRIYEEITGEITDFIRAPHGQYTEESKTAELLLSKPLICWNVDSIDFIYQKKEMVEHRLLNTIVNDSIVLLHDVYESTVDAIESCIPQLKEQGFRFVDLKTMFDIRGMEMHNNHIYKCVGDCEVFNDMLI